MGEHQFTLVISGDLESETTVDALFGAGCDDATLGTIDQVGYADFIREAPSFAEAVRSAIRQVESVPGLKVTRIEPDDLVTMAEIAERLGRSRESVRLLIQGERGPGGFPAPISHLKARSRLWRWSEVAAWAKKISAEPQGTRESLGAPASRRPGGDKVPPCWEGRPRGRRCLLLASYLEHEGDPACVPPGRKTEACRPPEPSLP